MARVKAAQRSSKMGIRQAVVMLAHQFRCGGGSGNLRGSVGQHVDGVLIAYIIRCKYVTNIHQARRLLFGSRAVSLFTCTMNQAAWTAASNGSKQFKLLTAQQYEEGLGRTHGVVQLWGYQHGIGLLGREVYRGECVNTAASIAGGVGGLLDESLYRMWARVKAPKCTPSEAWRLYCCSVLHIRGVLVVCEFGMIWPPQCGADIERLVQHMRL